MPDSFTSSPDDLTLALTDALRAALEGVPQLVLDAEQLAGRLAPGLSVRLAAAAEASGVTAPALTRALTTRSAASGPGADSLEARVLAALGRHASGRTPGVSPESLASLTGLSHSALGPVVSSLVQAGDLVRDGWLVRLPQAEDLLPSRRQAEPDRGRELRHATERAIGDRRAVGERRLFDRRAPG
jgi:DNA-binding MarR family transcriptional regulator